MHLINGLQAKQQFLTYIRVYHRILSKLPASSEVAGLPFGSS